MNVKIKNGFPSSDSKTVYYSTDNGSSWSSISLNQSSGNLSIANQATVLIRASDTNKDNPQKASIHFTKTGSSDNILFGLEYRKTVPTWIVKNTESLSFRERAREGIGDDGAKVHVVIGPDDQ